LKLSRIEKINREIEVRRKFGICWISCSLLAALGTRLPVCADYFLAFGKEKISYDGLRTIVNAKFCENVFQVRSNGKSGNGKAIANLRVAKTLGDQNKDFSLPL